MAGPTRLARSDCPARRDERYLRVSEYFAAARTGDGSPDRNGIRIAAVMSQSSVERAANPRMSLKRLVPEEEFEPFRVIFD